MEHFLSLTAEDLIRNWLSPTNGLSNITVVFPNKRARLFFDDYLSGYSPKPLWSPSYMTITELFQSHSVLRIADQYKLVSLLYGIYCDILHSEETIDSFWSWGELMLKDFDDIDRNMADADKLFSCLDSHKEMAVKPFLSDEQVQILKTFFEGFKGGDTELRQKYTQIWNSLGPIYHRFRDTLQTNGLAYEGMLQRNVASDFDAGRSGDRIYAFVGFNSLNMAEKTLFRNLRDNGKAIFYWDYDKSYIEDPNHEAGLFLRDNLKEFPNRLPEEHFASLSQDKQLTIIETSSDSAQARYIPKWIDLIAKSGNPDKDTAIILCDSGLLQPVIHSIPDVIGDGINITMGFPVSATPLYGYVSAIIDIQRAILKNGGRITIDLLSRYLNSPLTGLISANAQEICKEAVKSRRFHIKAEDLNADDPIRSVIIPSADNLHLIDRILESLRILAPRMNDDSIEDVYRPLYIEALYKIHTQITRIRTLTEEGSLDINADMLCRLLRKILATMTVPFHGEPVVGMQLMGMIETRNLDFRHILLLSATEGSLPSGNTEASFLPYSLRMAFGLTTMKEKSAVASYNFYHLLQRAESVTMIYNSNADQSGIGKGQISRYLLQLMVSGRPIRRISLQTGPGIFNDSYNMSVDKNGDVMQKLYDMYDVRDRKKYISPSALNSYLDCQSKYYLQYVAGIRAKRDEAADIDPALFGTLFHLSAELAYNFMAEKSHDRTITEEMLDNLSKDERQIGLFVRQAFNRELFNGKETLPSDYNGIQSINFEVICRYLRQIMIMDKFYAPFVYVESESDDFEHLISIPHPEDASGNLHVRISGRIDRIDCKNGIYRIADYKTGHVEKDPNTLDDLFDNSKERRRYALQTFYYATLVHYSGKYDSKRLAPVLLYIRSSAKPSAEGIYMKMANEPITDFSGGLMNEYIAHLRDTISSIFNPEIPFAQTGLPDTCSKCDFKEICHKHL